jgi:microcin C transport system substrate-binding protein
MAPVNRIRWGRRISRRDFIRVSASAAAFRAGAPVAIPFSGAAEQPELHGLSIFGDLKYPPNFRHFANVNPDASKSGVFSQVGPNSQYNQNLLTFNTLNSYVLKGDAAQGMQLTFATLMARALDENSAAARSALSRRLSLSQI